MDLKGTLLAACLAAALIGATGAVHAGTATAWSGAAAGPNPSDQDQEQVHGGTASASSQAAWEERNGSAHASGSVIAGEGFVKVYGDALGQGGLSEGWPYASGGGQARFIEDLTFASAAHAGMPGQVTVSVLFDAELQSFGAAGATTSFSLFLGGQQRVVFGQIHNGGFPVLSRLFVFDAFGQRDLPYDRIATVTFDVTWGGTLKLDMNLLSEAHTFTPTTDDPTTASGATSDTSHSGYWGGIVSATAGGVPIDDFSVLSSTGVDYRNSFAVAAPVPEPETVALLAVGLLAVWGRAHRGRRAGVA